MRSFIQWLTEEVEDNRLRELAEFIYQRIYGAAVQYVDDYDTGDGNLAKRNTNGLFRNYLLKFWPENDRRKRFKLPSQFSEFQGIDIEIGTGDGAEIQRNNGTPFRIFLGTGALDTAKTVQELNQFLNGLRSSIHHEVTHINHAGGDIPSADPSHGDMGEKVASLRYLMMPGEMQSHAAQFANAFAQEFPGEPFDANKFLSQVIQNLPKNQQVKATNYLQAFADPNKQKLYDPYLNGTSLAQVNQQFLGMIQQYLQSYGKTGSPKMGLGFRPQGYAKRDEPGFKPYLS